MNTLLMAEPSEDTTAEFPYAELGRRVAEARNRIGWSQRVLAKHVGVSDGYLPRIETGRNQPSTKVLQNLARWLGLDYNELATLAGYQRGPRTADDIDIADPEMELLFRQLETADLPEESRETIKEFIRFSLQRHWAKHPDSKLGR